MIGKVKEMEVFLIEELDFSSVGLVEPSLVE